ncbi:MAG TPA: dihydrolipoyl dehydrogenase [Bdellovibrionota bacterium]|nr:dihydrolipoyl dehydrogenase [Bdellovibrionota bacterium]
MAETFDVLIIGSGPGGYVAAIRAAQLGLNTACVEKRKTLGGTCLNIGCIPSKALLDTTHHFAFAKEKFGKHGILADGLRMDHEVMMKRKDAVVRQLTNGIGALFKKNKITHLEGHGSFVSAAPGAILVAVQGPGGTTQVSARNVIIATGSDPVELPFLKFDGDKVVSSTEALSFASAPKRLAVIGGGVIGLELGSVWARLGSKVSVIEFAERIVPTMDAQISKEFQKILTKQGLEFSLSTKCAAAKVGKTSVTLELEDKNTGAKSQLEADKVLVAVGRRPYTDGLALDKAGVAKDERGRVAIDNHFRTNVPGIYAIGDVVIGAMLAHKAEDEGIACAEIIAGSHGHVNYDAIPSVVYTAPELASVGKTEEELKAAGIEFASGTFPFMVNGRAKAMEETEGLVKILADARTDRLLGCHILGPHAGDLIHEAATVIEYGGSAEDMARICHAHPTLSEVVREAALDVGKRKIHL